MSTNTTNTSNTTNTTNTTNTNEKKTDIFVHVFLFILSIIFLLIGISIIRQYSLYNTTTSAKVLETNCENYRTNRGMSYSCNIKLEYYVKEIQSYKTQIINTSNVIYSIGDTISIRYNNANASQIILASDTNKLTGFVFSIIGVLLLLLLFLILIGVVSPIQTSSIVTSNRIYQQPYYGFRTYLTPEQTFASSLGVAIGSKIANKI